MRWRAGVTKINGKIDSENFDSREDAEAWVLKQAEEGIKKSIIFNKDNIRERFYETWEEK